MAMRACWLWMAVEQPLMESELAAREALWLAVGLAFQPVAA